MFFEWECEWNETEHSGQQKLKSFSILKCNQNQQPKTRMYLRFKNVERWTEPKKQRAKHWENRRVATKSARRERENRTEVEYLQMDVQLYTWKTRKKSETWHWVFWLTSFISPVRETEATKPRTKWTQLEPQPDSGACWGRLGVFIKQTFKWTIWCVRSRVGDLKSRRVF